MGRIGLVLSAVRNFVNGIPTVIVKSDPGGGNINSGEQFGPIGDDSVPLPSDYDYKAPTERTGNFIVLGYLDPNLEAVAEPGDKRIYARDLNTGAAVASLWLQNDGTVVLSNANGGWTLLPNGTIDLNGVLIDQNGNITAGNSLIVGGRELNNHVHLAGTPPGNTGPNL